MHQLGGIRTLGTIASWLAWMNKKEKMYIETWQELKLESWELDHGECCTLCQINEHLSFQLS